MQHTEIETAFAELLENAMGIHPPPIGRDLHLEKLGLDRRLPIESRYLRWRHDPPQISGQSRRLISITLKLRDWPSTPVPTNRKTHSIRDPHPAI